MEIASITATEVGATAAFLCSGLASGITGEVVHVGKNPTAGCGRLRVVD